MEALLDPPANKCDLPHKCPYCGSMLAEEDHPHQMRPQKKSKWDNSTTSVVISLLILGPLALPKVWFNPRYSILKKALITT
ncbi:MAG: hypothetical protein KAS23_07435, partial [Anaerohalosphaera sp.]|nr:hypothetical protein [Anaerohalosphaera sp.]